MTTLDIHNEALWKPKSYKPEPLARDPRPLNRGIPYTPVIDEIARMKWERQRGIENDPETIHLSYQPRLEPATRLTDGMLHLAKHMGTSKWHQGHRIHRSNGGGGRGDWRLPPQYKETGWSEGLEELPADKTYAKDMAYEHGPLPTPDQVLLWQWKNAKQCKKYEGKQMSWRQLEMALNENQNTGHHLSLDQTSEDEGNSWGPTIEDPMDVLMEVEQDEIREESRQYRLALLMDLLSPRMKQAITLKAEGWSYKEIASQMGCSAERAKELLKDGRKRARALGN